MLAHPERYIYMDRDDYQKLKEMGIRLQLNLLSLPGAYGKEADVKAQQLLKINSYDLAGTDLHSATALQTCVLLGEIRKYRRLNISSL